MMPKLRTIVVLFACGYFLSISCVRAEDGSVDNRMDAVNRALDCVSDHSGEGGLGWADVCYTSDREDEDGRPRRNAKSMEQAIREQEYMAQEMLSDDNDSDTSHGTYKDMDDVEREHQQYYRDTKTVDNFIDEQGIYEGDASGDQESVQDEDSMNNEYDHSRDRSRQENVNDYPRYASADTDSKYSEDDDSFLPRSNGDPAAETNRLDRALKNGRDQAEKHFGLGLELYGYNYKEPSLGVELDSNGPFYGGFMNYSYRPAASDGLFDDILDVYMVEGSLRHGFTNYSSSSGTQENSSNFIWEFRGLVGKDLMVSEKSRITPYSGIGYRYLKHDFGDPTVGPPYGYDRESRYLYLPIGFEYTTPLIDGWVFIPNAEVDILLQGWQTSYLTDVPGIDFDVKNKQKSGYGVRGSLKFLKQGDRMDFIVEPFIRHWYIEDSTFDSHGFYEPRNKTTEGGVRLGAQF